MPVVAVIGKLSGTGKTMASVLLASEWAHRNAKVLLLDADPIPQSMYWGGLASELAEKHPEVDTFDAALGRRPIDELERAYDLIVIDCPPQDDDALLRVIAVADLVVVPCRAREMDVEPLASIASLLSAARDQAQGRAVDAVALISRRSLERPFDVEVEAAIRGAGLPVLETHLHQRVILQQAFESGASAREFAPCSPAEEEIGALATELEGRLARCARR